MLCICKFLNLFQAFFLSNIIYTSSDEKRTALETTNVRNKLTTDFTRLSRIKECIEFMFLAICVEHILSF